MEFGILGTLEWTIGGLQVDLHRAKLRAVLAVLLLHSNQVVSVDRLMDALWGENPPPSAINTLQGYISQVRRVLATDADAAVTHRPELLTQAPGYMLVVAPESVDAWRFQAMAAEARRELASGRAERAATMLAEALSLWRGAALADFADQPFAVGAAARMEEQRLLAVEDQADAELALGRHGELAGRLQSLVGQHPLRERLRGQLMVALYRCGRQAEALRAFQEARRTLREELGIDPSPALRRLEADLLAQARHLDWQPERGQPPSGGGIPTTAHGPDRDLAAEGIRAHDTIPVQLTSFVGRAAELEVARQLLAGTRVLTFTGSGGCGKTRLAIELAVGVERGGRRLWFVDLGGVHDPELVAVTLANSLGLAQGSGFDLGPVCERIGADEALMVLDNCEHVVESCARLVEALLMRCPNLKVLATSREELLVRGETVWRVPSLSLGFVDDPRTRSVVLGSEAVQLFIERGSSALPGFDPDESGLATIGRICHRLDGIPLAIELAAALVAILPVCEIARRLEQSFDLLTRGVRSAVPRQQTLQATIDWSYDHLNEPERRLFARLSVFAGQFTIEAAEATTAPVATGEPGTADSRESGFIDVLSALVSKSMVVAVAGFDGTRGYRLLNSLRDYGLARLRASGAEGEARRRHAAFFVSFAEAADRRLHGQDATDWCRRIVREFSNLQLALDWSFSSDGDLEVAVRLAGALRWWFFARMGQLAQAKKWLDIALERRHELTGSLQLKAMTAAMSIAFSLGDYTTTAGIGEEAVALAENLGDHEDLATALMSRGGAAIYEGDLQRARECLDRSLGYCRGLGDRWGTAFVLGFSGLAWRRMGNAARAQLELEEALSIFRDLRDDHNQVAPMMQLALLAERAGELDRAMQLCNQAIGLARKLGDGQLAHAATCIAGRVELSRWNTDEARRLLTMSLHSYPGVEHQLMMAIAVEGLAILAHREERHSSAVELWGFAQQLRLTSAVPLSQERLVEQRRHLDEASGRIGRPAVEAALVAGGSLSIGEVLARATGSSGAVPGSGT